MYYENFNYHTLFLMLQTTLLSLLYQETIQVNKVY